METVVELNHVSKSFEGRRVLGDVELKIMRGSTVGIVGANGSGKSVLFKLICGFLKPDSGEVKIRGERLGHRVDFPENVGVLINKPGYIDFYDGYHNLKYLAGIQNKITKEKILGTMQLVGLDFHNKTSVRNYSMGMKQKLGIAQAIMEDQDIIILDEPFNALDHSSYKEIKELIKSLQLTGRTVLLTSHNFSDINELCSSIYMIEDSQLKELTNADRHSLIG